METIMSYIDNLFRNYPDSRQVRRAREELLSIMEDKYNELKAEGKSENEAIGIVISEFGSIGELTEELGLEGVKTQETAEEDAESKKQMTMEEAKAYLSHKKSFGSYIAAGVALCILSPTAACILDPLAEAGFLSGRVADMIGAVAVFLMVAAGIAMFIVKGIENGKYEDLTRKKIVLDYSTKQYVNDEAEQYQRVFAKQIAAGVMLCIFSVIPIVFLETFFENGSLEWICDAFGGAALFVLVAAGVACFITGGITMDAYELVLGRKDVKKIEKQERVMEVVSGVYWCVITAIYLAWSFFSMNWGTTWVIWPIAGVLFGAIAVIVKFAAGDKK